MTVSAPVRYRLSEAMLADVPGTHRAIITPTEPGTVAGLEALTQLARPSGQFGALKVLCRNGDDIAEGTPIVEIIGDARQLAAAGDMVLGPLGYAGGIARRCRDIEASRPRGLRVVCGGWKKLPAELKPLLREGLAAGGVAPRLVDGDFVYVDKNVVALADGIEPAVARALRLGNGPVAVQVTDPESALVAVRAGAKIIMDDTGSLDVLCRIEQALRASGWRDHVTLAFAGGVTVDSMEMVRHYGADVVDLGRAILDAPLWDVHMVVQR